VDPAVTERTVQVDAASLASIRIGQFDPTTVRVVLDVTVREHVDAFLLTNPHRLVIDVRAPDNALDFSRETPGQISETVQEAAPPTPVAAVETVAAAELVTTPASPTLAGDHSMIRSLGLKIGRVVIDPGHGGHDTGTIGPSGLREKDVVLEIAQGLKERIESEMGAEVVLTRSDDSFISLDARTALANQAKADLFLSIHVNSSSTGSVRGFETYILNMATTGADREIAARENASSQASVSELQDLVSKIMVQDKADESREFAARVQQAMARAGDFGRDRGVKEAPFVVLIGAEMPSILAEVSFISNRDDEERLRDDEGRSEIVDALFEGVRSYAETLSGFRTAQVE
jgi:N-acetylmuramoyl-L-alanine amidase